MPKINIELGYSKKLAHFIVFSHLGAMLSCFWLPVSWPFKLIVALVCSVNMLCLLKKHVQRKSKNAIVRLWQKADHNWYLETTSGAIISARIAPNSLRTPTMVILNFKVTNKWRTIPVIIIADAIAADIFRQLRVYLLVNKSSVLNS